MSTTEQTPQNRGALPPALGNPARLHAHETGIPELDDLLAQHVRIVDEHRQVKAAANQLRADRPRAERSDIEAGAAAVIAGKPDPGPAASAKLAEDLATATRRAASLRLAADTVRTEYLAAFRARRVELAALVLDNVAQTRRQAHQDLDAALQALSAYEDARELARWAHEGPGVTPVGGPRRPVEVGSISHTVTVVVASLAAFLDRPTPLEARPTGLDEPADRRPAS
jgi:hypothetical protein